jgi:hypothetical protein
MKITKSKVVQIANALEAIKSTNKMLTYAIIKNKKIIESEVDALREAIKTDSDEYKNYATEIREITNKYGARDDAGRIITTLTGFKPKEDVDLAEVQEIINGVNEKYKEAIDARDKQLEQYNNMLNDEVDIEFYDINLELLPDDTDPKIIDTLFDLIKD